MRYKYLPLLLSLAVALGSCKKDEPDPEPTLEGNWNEHSMRHYTYDAAGTLASQYEVQYKLPTGRYPSYYTFTSTTRQRFNDDGTVASVVGTYSRVGTALTYDNQYPPMASATITQLTATDLTIRCQYLPLVLNNFIYFVEEYHYVRR